jgi:diguanylate cyclase (GGDEF)-like protein/PAS domain S-box-containing protein
MFLFYVRERRLKKSVLINEKLLQAIINNIPNPVFYKDREGVFRHANDAFAKSILGLSRDAIVGKKLHDLEGVIPLELIVFHQNQDALLYENHNSLEYENVVQMHDGSLRDFQVIKKVFKSEDEECLGYIGIMSDITEHKEKEKKLQELASVDPLTKLYNRRYFSTVSNHLLTLAKRDKESISVVMLDIDDFKAVNDTYGHKIGDDVIIKLANILLATSRESDIVARFGGEEFVLLLPKTEIKGAFVIAEKIRKKVQEIFIPLENAKKISFTISLGVSEINVQDESDVEEGIKRADSALYSSKRSGKNRVSIA